MKEAVYIPWGREGGRVGGWWEEGERERREEGTEGGRGREGEMEGGRDGGRVGGRDGGSVGGKKGRWRVSGCPYWCLLISCGLYWSALVSCGLYWSPVISGDLYWSLLVSDDFNWSTHWFSSSLYVLGLYTSLQWYLLPCLHCMVSTSLQWSLLIYIVYGDLWSPVISIGPSDLCCMVSTGLY